MPAQILVVEDNTTNLQLMAYLLRAFGHNVSEALSGAEGLEQVSKHSFDLMLLDVHMPGIDGMQVLAHVKADPALKGLPIVAVTALAMVGDRDRLLEAGFDGYIAKPIEPESFLRQVGTFLPARVKSGPV